MNNIIYDNSFIDNNTWAGNFFKYDNVNNRIYFVADNILFNDEFVYKLILDYYSLLKNFNKKEVYRVFYQLLKYLSNRFPKILFMHEELKSIWDEVSYFEHGENNFD